MSDSEEYSRDAAIAEFFDKTYTTRTSCDNKALELIGGKIVPVEVQGVCSYTVYAGADLNYIVQFRLASLNLDMKTMNLANKIYAPLPPTVKYCGELGSDEDKTGKERLLVYVMDRIRGISYLDFILKYGYPQNSESNFIARENLMTDIARFMARSWNAPQEVSSEYRAMLTRKYATDLQLLLVALPVRFHAIIQGVLDHLDSLFSLPMVLLHRDFGSSNILVEDKTCHLTGVIDWAEAEICPFGQNLHSLEAFTGSLHLQRGWSRYKDYENLQIIFWNTFNSEIGKCLTQETKKAIETSRVLGLLLSRGFTSRLANASPPTPISDDSAGRYNMLSLDGFLLDQETKFTRL